MTCSHCGTGTAPTDVTCRVCGALLALKGRAVAAGVLTPIPEDVTGAFDESLTGALPGTASIDADLTHLGDGGSMPLEATGVSDDGATFLGPAAAGPTPDAAPDEGATRLEPAAPASGARRTSGIRRAISAARASNPDGPLDLGQNFGARYHIIKLLGVGGMGAVYQAWDAELGVAVALKVIRPEMAGDPAAAQDLERRFKRELLLARQVTHKNVVRIHDLGEIDGIKYITMPFVNGEDLATVLQREVRLPVPRVLRIARQVVAGLGAAHDAGVVHRDLKPANIMLDVDDEALIMDFGIARSSGGPGRGPGSKSNVRLADLQQSAVVNHTMAGAIVGTVHYMAPEQARGLPVDQRADIYAFGLIVYDMLLGRRRAELSANVIAELQARMVQAPAAPRSVDPSVPEPVDRIVARCIDPDATKRYATTVDLAADLERLTELGELKPMPRRFTPRLIAAAVALVAAIVGGTWWLARTPAAPVQHAPISVLVADFANQTGDPAFDSAVEQALTLGIEGASFIRAYPRGEAVKVAHLLELPGGVDEKAARLVAQREDIKVILAGAIASEGSGYTLSVRVLDAAANTGKTELASVSVRAKSKDEVLPAVASLASTVRLRLGDSDAEIAKHPAADSFTTSSLDALKAYAQAQAFQATGQKPEAMDAFKRAIDNDPKFGLAYSGAAVMANVLGRTDEAQAYWKTMLTLLDRMSERERYRGLGTYYLGSVRNYEQAIPNFEKLVALYPADRYGRSNLALAYFWSLNMPKALEQGRLAADLDRKNLLIHNNYALYAMYAGQFDVAAREANAVIGQERNYYLAYVPRAMAALARDDAASARQAYEEMAKTGAPGASLAAVGLADLALYEGRDGDAIAILNDAIGEDRKAQNIAGLAAKSVLLAEAYEQRGANEQAIDAANAAIEIGKNRVEAQVPAAVVLLRAGHDRVARSVAAELAQRLQPQDRARAKMLEGLIALKQRRLADAVEAFNGARKLADLWPVRFNLGVAFIEAGHYAEGLAEIEECRKRRGEATAIFLNEVPSFRYLAPLPYWLARAQQELGMKDAAAANYKAFLALRPASPADPLVRDARSRAATK